MRALVILAVLAACAAPVRARAVCAVPSAPAELKLPGYTKTRDTPACARRVEAAYAAVQKDADAFLDAERAIFKDVTKILELQNGAACEPSARSYISMRRRQYAAVVKALAAELVEGVGPCGLVAPAVSPEPAPDSDEAPKQDLPPMLEPI